uniref:Uncharacterized protein n=1 Tax=Arundo donax TaxID=35708 RepID=A0A0A9D2L6_ARUDO
MLVTVQISLANTSLERSTGCCFNIHKGVCFGLVDRYCFTLTPLLAGGIQGITSMWLHPL